MLTLIAMTICLVLLIFKFYIKNKEGQRWARIRFWIDLIIIATCITATAFIVRGWVNM